MPFATRSITLSTLCLATLLWAGCGGPARPSPPLVAGDPASTPPEGFSLIEGAVRPDPFSFPDLWPALLDSERFPIRVRYALESDQPWVAHMLRHLERAWQIHTEVLGFRPPLAYHSDRFTVFVWHGLDRCLALPGQRSDAVEWEAFETYLVIDPDADCGDGDLAVTTAHELHRAIIMGYDPWEADGFSAASGIFVEDLVMDEANRYLGLLADFQQQPQRALTYDDGRATDYVYGLALYLFFLNEHVFPADSQFLSRIWDESKGTRGDWSIYAEATPPTASNATWVAGVNAVLPHGTSFGDTVAGLAVWRWYVGNRSAGRHFSEAALFPLEAEVPFMTLEVSDVAQVETAVALTGSAYFLVRREPDGAREAPVTFDGDVGIEWRVQQLPGERGEDAVPINGWLHFGENTEVGVVVTALPRTAFDPREVTEETFSFRLTVGSEDCGLEGCP